MDMGELLQDIRPISGQVIPIKTIQEARPAEEFADAYVTEVNVKSASKVIKALDAKFPRDPSQPLTHLRRFAKYPQLSDEIRSALVQGEPSHQTIFVMIPPPLPEKEALQELLAPFAPTPPQPSTDTTDAPSSTPPAPTIRLHTVSVPIQPPLNPVQAEKWTKTLWPVVYNPAAPRATIAPPPQILNRVHESIKPKAGRYMALARKVGAEAEQSGLGRGVGAVVVDPELEDQILDVFGDGEDVDAHWTDAIVAVAGDARYSRREGGAMSEAETQLGPGLNPHVKVYDADVEGGPDLHALMRAVELIACKRRGEEPGADMRVRPLEAHFMAQSDIKRVSEANAESEGADSAPPEKYQRTDEEGGAVAVSKEEGPVPRIRSRSQGGYLCTDLDVYLTHEPCVCCSMGMLLSRFRAVVFPRQGRLVTGGLASAPVVGPVADGGEVAELEGQPERMYYGLNWRKELNWRAIGFEFIEDEPVEQAYDEVAYHA